MPFPRLICATLLAAVSLLGLMAPSVAEAATDSVELELVSRINSFRAERGLAPLAVSNTLAAAAEWMSVDMGARNYFAHTSLDGRSPTQRMADAGYPAFTTWTGEDLAAGQTTTAEVLKAWIASPAHHAVLVSPHYRAVGIGRAYTAGSKYGWYWTADFGGVVDAGRPAPAPRAAVRTVGVAPAAPAAQPQLPPDSGYHARWLSQTPDPVLRPNEVRTLVVALRNAGSRGWYKGEANRQVTLGTNDPLNGDRTELAEGWLSGNRLASTTTTYVGPGEVGWFEFRVRAPAAPGQYTLSVRGVVDGVDWLEDDGIFFTIQVRPGFAGGGLTRLH
jgi:hypothetical protein